MAMKSSKIAVTLQPSLKLKLREYGKDNQIKNFSGVILAILDEYFGETDSTTSATSQPSEVWDAINALSDRLDVIENGTATNAPAKPKRVAKPSKVSANRRTNNRVTTSARPKPKAKSTSTRTTTAKSSKSVSKPSRTAKAAATKKSTTAKTSTRGSSSRAKTPRPVKSSSKAAPVRKTKTASTSRAASGRKSAKSKASASNEWMSTREAFNIYGGNLSWSRFSKLTPEELKDRFNLDSDLSRKVRGSRFNQWLKPGK